MGGRTSTAVDEDANQGENFTSPKRKICLLRAVSLLYEDQLSAIKNSVEPGSMEETEFEALVPNFPAMASSLYR